MFLTENSDEANDLRQKFQHYRGSVVSSFAHCEFFIGAFLLAMEDDPKLKSSVKFSYRVETRIKNFREAFEANEVLQSFREDALVLIDAFEKVIDDRNAFTHGLAELDIDRRQVKVRKFQPRKGDNGNQTVSTYELDSMEKSVRIFDDICRHIIVLILNVDLKLELGLAPDHYKNGAVWYTESTE